MSDDRITIHLYEHGGGRIFSEKEHGNRDLIVDLYGDGERRDAIINALIAAEILPPRSKCNVVEV